jgi:hypothetical protein
MVLQEPYLLIFEIVYSDGYMRPSLVVKISIDPLLHVDMVPSQFFFFFFCELVV